MNDVANEKQYERTKCFSHDFSGQDLSRMSFNHGTFVTCNFRGCDLTQTTFVGANCYGSDFKDAIMDRTNFKDAVLASSIFDPKYIFGVTLTMTCDTFANMKIGRTALLYWVYMPLLMDSADKELTDKLVNAIGTDQFLALNKVFREAV